MYLVSPKFNESGSSALGPGCSSYAENIFIGGALAEGGGFRDIEEIFKDIDEARSMFPHIGSIFLIDGNVLALKTEFLLKVLEKSTKTFPECSKISLYCGFNDLRRKSVEDLKELRKAGLSKAYTGLVPGDPVTLERIKKGLTPEQAEEGMAKAKAAGIDVLVSMIFGIGGKERSRKHILYWKSSWLKSS